MIQACMHMHIQMRHQQESSRITITCFNDVASQNFNSKMYQWYDTQYICELFFFFFSWFIDQTQHHFMKERISNYSEMTSLIPVLNMVCTITNMPNIMYYRLVQLWEQFFIYTHTHTQCPTTSINQTLSTTLHRAHEHAQQNMPNHQT